MCKGQMMVQRVHGMYNRCLADGMNGDAQGIKRREAQEMFMKVHERCRRTT